MVTATAHAGLLHGDVSEQILGGFFDVFNGLGYGFLEVVYRRAMHVELRRRCLAVASETRFEVRFAGELVGEYRADLVVERRIIVECKAVERLTEAHEAQLLNYLQASGLPVGLLLNFGPKPTFRRLIRSSPKKPL